MTESKTFRMARAINRFIDETLEQSGPNALTDALTDYINDASAESLALFFDCVMLEVRIYDL